MSSYLALSVFLFLTALLTSRNRTHNVYSLFLGALLIFVYILLTGAYIVSDYFTGEGINDAVMYHLKYGLEGSGLGDYYLIITIGFCLFLASFILAYFYYHFSFLLRVNDTIEINPFFEVDVKHFKILKLFGFLKDFKAEVNFVCGEKCSRISLLNDDTDKEGKLCYAFGKFGGL